MLVKDSEAHSIAVHGKLSAPLPAEVFVIIEVNFFTLAISKTLAQKELLGLLDLFKASRDIRRIDSLNVLTFKAKKQR